MQPDPQDPIKLVAARGASILAGWANNSSAAKRAARRRAEGLDDPLQAPQIDAAAEAKIAGYLEAYLREKLEEEIARGYHDKVNVCFSTDYQPDHRIQAMCIALEIFKVEWPWKRHLWLRVHGGRHGGEFGADEDNCQRVLKIEDGRPRGWLVSPHVIPRPLHDLVIEAVLQGRLNTDVADWEPLEPARDPAIVAVWEEGRLTYSRDGVTCPACLVWKAHVLCGTKQCPMCGKQFPEAT